MNFSKKIFKYQQVCCYINNNLLHKRFLNVSSVRRALHVSNIPNPQKLTKRKLFVKDQKCCSYDSSNIIEMEEITGIYPYIEGQPLARSELPRRVLFKNNVDPKIMEIERCASVEEVFKFVRDNVHSLTYKHLTQIVLALYDLQNIFVYHYEEEDNIELRDTFFKKLLEHKEFYMVTKAIEDSLNCFDPLFLSYILLFLNRLGVSEESQLIQNMAMKLRDHLLNDFSLDIVARLTKVIFTENSIRPYYIVIDLIPKIFMEIDSITTTKDLEDLTICLHKLIAIATDDVLCKYESKVKQLIKNKILTGADYQLILKIMSLFNFPHLRNQYSQLIAECILLMKNSIELLSLSEMYLLYEIFFKIQEPGEALNAIQRAAAKLLHEIDDSEANQRNKLKLFSSVIYFSSPISKEQFRNDIEKYMKEKESLSSLVILRKIYSYLKISNPKMCDTYWNKACELLKEEKDFDKTMRLVENYLYFCGDLHGFRHYTFEHHVLTMIQKHFSSGSLTIFPSRFFASFAFALISSYNPKFLDTLLQTLDELGPQMTPTDVFKLSHSLQVLRQRKSVATSRHINQINNILHNATARFYKYSDLRPDFCGLLVKAAIIRNDFDNQLIDDMLITLKHTKYMSSKLMEYMCFNLYATRTLIPEILNLCTEYVVHHKANIIGFNAGKLLYLLYQLNYQPVYEDEFLGAITDIIIRDQERMSGLGFLQSALSLSFFGRMPKSFVKQIFNVEFLDKLDVELASCYFRDRYPHRVRDILMQLNRAVCLEYPEYNIPWFHQKYIEEYQKNRPIDDLVNHFQRSVRGYLIGVLGKETIKENVTVPYGYEVNFILHLDKNKRPTDKFDDLSTTKLALLLKYENAFTRMYVRLKGKHALKNRHLEILGYKVRIINRNEWSNLLYSKERVDYINNIVFS